MVILIINLGGNGDPGASAISLAEQREPLIKVAYASNDGEVKGFVYRRPPPNSFAMSEQDVDDVAFLTGKGEDKFFANFF